MLSNPLYGVYYFFKGFGLIFKPGIRGWVLLPLLINIILFSTLIYYGWLYEKIVTQWLSNQLQQYLPEWLTSTLSGIIFPLLFTISLTILTILFTFIATWISAPFNSLLAAAVETHLRGKPVHYPSSSFLLAIIDFFWKQLLKLVYYLFWALILLIITLIPLINLISPILWFLFGAWLISLEYADAPLSNYGYRPKMQRRLLAKKRLLVLGFGSTVVLVMIIPLLNFFVMPIAVAGATCIWVEELRELADF
jgi:CysZ protein